MADFQRLLAEIARRPAMYVGVCSVSRVANYLDGYCHAIQDVGHEVAPLRGWLRWVEVRFSISNPEWHWTRILLHQFGSDLPAIQAIPALYAEFAPDVAASGLAGIEARHDQMFRDPQGQYVSRVPKSTPTKCSRE